ncbi:MAG: hypothetical protein Q9160_008438 [Pyrenula sp. 1 TL-2023]
MDNGIYEDDSVYPDPEELNRFPWMGDNANIAPNEFLSLSRGPIIHERFVPHVSPDGYGSEMEVDDEGGLEVSHRQFAGRLDDYSGLGNYDARDSSYSLSEESPDDLEFSDEDGSDKIEDDGPYARTRARRAGRRGSIQKESGRGRGRGGRRGRGRPGGKRGPRKAADPSPEFREILQGSKNSYFQGNYDEALRLVEQAIGINPEIFSAHLLKSTIHKARSELDQAALALYLGAHSFPRDPEIWRRTIEAFNELADKSEGQTRQKYLRRINACYHRLIAIDPDDYEARLKRAICLKDSGYLAKALTQLNDMLQKLPHNVGVLEQMAIIYIELKQFSRIIQLYEDCIEYNETVPQERRSFSFEDVLIFADLLAKDGRVGEAIKRLKSLSRWLLGRQTETYWDDVQEDDREWDAEDFPRRQQVAEFEAARFPIEGYGYGLPLELRTLLGTLRFQLNSLAGREAFLHFEWLEPDDRQEGAKIYQYSSLFRTAGETYKNARLYKEALRFYQPLIDLQSFTDAEFYYSAGVCSLRCAHRSQAANCFEDCKAADTNHIEARVELAGIYNETGDSEKGQLNATEAIYLGRQAIFKPHRRRYERAEDRIRREEEEKRLKEIHNLKIGNISRVPNKRRDAATLAMRPVAPIWNKGEGLKGRREDANLAIELLAGPDDPLPSVEQPESTDELASDMHRGDRRRTERDPDVVAQQQERVQNILKVMLSCQAAMRAGDLDARNTWLDAAEALTQFFRRNPAFYPASLKNYPQAKSWDDRERILASGLLYDDSLADTERDSRPSASSMYNDPPTTYFGITFPQWLDIFLEFALVLSTMGEARKALCYKLLDAAIGCVIWWRSKEAMLQIYVCYMTCSLRLNDSETMTRIVARWFIREYQFVTDTYRLFNALNLLYRFPNTRRDLQMKSADFRTGASQKYFLRQIKMIDYNLPEDYGTLSEFGSVPPFMRKTKAGRTRGESSKEDGDEDDDVLAQDPEEMDIALLVLFGHILYAAGSFTNALNYFFRAYSLNAEHPMTLFSIALAYCHNQTKRQSEDRHGNVIQGLAFFQKYQESRLNSVSDQPSSVRKAVKMEIDFNEARLWEMMGLNHLAVQGYKNLLTSTESHGRDDDGGDSRTTLVNREEQEDFSMEAAYALQTIYTLSGDAYTARQITEKWLVIE